MVVVDNSDLNHGRYEYTACIVFLCITPAFLIARFASRILSRQLGRDDWAALAAFAFIVACNVLTLSAFSHGWGRHKKNLTPKNLEIALILHWVFQITYKLAVAMNKTSILLLYSRIMPQRIYRISIYSLLALVALFGLATTIAGVFQCVPVQKAWLKNTPGHCYNLVDAWYSNAVFSIVTDFLILMLPMHMVYKLQRDNREKLLLYGVFGLGFFVTFTSIMRFFALKAAKSPDTTYEISSGFWSVIEINVGVICVCLPPLRSILSRHFKIFKKGSSAEGPYGVRPDPPSELVTIGGSKGAQTRALGLGHRRKEMEDSEEELVFFTHENTPTINDSGITKKTEFAITEMHIIDDDIADQKRLKPWEGGHHAS